ncbi:peptide chain release factor 1-like, mitochondrial isoform X2 [Bos javanicus]|uniref:peptide chain release factor 1-like, mitochondrial isoform X2 n=1 Tax=Bos javanicus TaxID=9906 RepID=UPI002AA73ECE|nr:peptide chain release factor 1-like, mitochondrial isoform X2 [Bos javanicus]
MRPRLVWNVFRGFWARRRVVPACRHLSCSNLPLEELFARGGALRTFLERQVGSEAQFQVRRPELVAVAKLLSDKEQELQETQHLLHGGLRHASASIGGSEAYKHMKFEGGVHRVQRVPKTEKQGRIHTSTMTVAILPQPTEINLVINPKDLRIDTKRASGAGGQHVNTTDSAVRIVHLPTGIVSECQQERSQLKNKEMAMKKLRAKLYSLQLEEETSKRYSARKIQIGTKGRSEKIRTYNFPQNRVTDHRINKSLHDLETFMQGEYLLDELVQSLKDYANYESLVEIIAKEV